MAETRQAYWIAHVRVTDDKAYADYKAKARGAIAAHGGTFLTRGGRYQQMEGPERAWNTLAVFPSFEAAVTCYNSPAYQAAVAIARTACERELVIVEAN
ncbi:DUF1330 domain-containing protein [Afifella pfennigii]|uniref:DUF1330 domain-containing protein n=1 Tax=Afifella pfennigii TaxID=209897 RepID=UPI00047D3488|nr:DUF1330 domain-containing protein [Afifella pfennigii]